MRLAVALLLAVVAAAPAAAQQPAASKPKQPAQPAQSSQPNPPVKPAPPNEAEERLRQRILLQEKFNKGWDIQPEGPRERKARCRAEARKRYSALHPLKRRSYQKNCLAGAQR
jgi:hypothetical protein